MRLCVETGLGALLTVICAAAASVRLCVETENNKELCEELKGSRLRAAVC